MLRGDPPAFSTHRNKFFLQEVTSENSDPEMNGAFLEKEA